MATRYRSCRIFLSFQSFPDGAFAALRFGGVKSDSQQSGVGTSRN